VARSPSERDGLLAALRERIDDIDQRLQALIDERVRLAMEVGRIKTEQGDRFFYRPEREAKILNAVVARNQGPLRDEQLAHIFREIISASLALEAPMRVAYLGPEGTFTQAAALKHFGQSVSVVPAATVDEVFRTVERRGCHFGVVPVENSTEGMIAHTLDMFLDSRLRICGEVMLRIEHNLLAAGGDLSAVARVYAHSQSLGQCRRWLSANLPGVERLAVASNADAARRVMDDPGSAAIASRTAAEIYGLQTLAANIEDDPGNTTRFLVIGELQTGPSGRDKTSVVVSAQNRPGALYHLIEPIAAHGLSMTRIESRPTRRGLWEYAFFFDVEGHAEDEPVARALAELERTAAYYRLLGSYPQSVA